MCKCMVDGKVFLIDLSVFGLFCECVVVYVMFIVVVFEVCVNFMILLYI